MADLEQKPSFYERRWFQGTVAVVGLATAVWALVGAPTPWKVATSLSSNKFALVNTEIVLDASSGMADSFGERTKLEAAAEAVGQYVVPLHNSGLALRRAGGSCSESGDLLVDFGADHNDDVTDAAAEQQPAGSSNLIYAVRAAIDDFAAERFRGPSSSKRILIFMGGEDQCAEDAASEIRHELDGTGIDAVFRLVALKVSKSQLEGLEAFREALRPVADVEIRTADTEEQLDDVMQQEEAETAEAGASAAAIRAESPQEETPETEEELPTEEEPPTDDEEEPAEDLEEEPAEEQEEEAPAEEEPPAEAGSSSSEGSSEAEPSPETSPAPEASTSASDARESLVATCLRRMTLKLSRALCRDGLSGTHLVQRHPATDLCPAVCDRSA